MYIELYGRTMEVTAHLREDCSFFLRSSYRKQFAIWKDKVRPEEVFFFYRVSKIA